MGSMNGTLRTVLSAVAALFILQTHAQANGAPKGCKPPINRQLRHDYVDREQRNILRMDGRADVYFAATKDEDINYLVTRTLTQKVDALQCAIETDTITSHNTKVTYLSGLEKLLRNFGTAFRARRISGSSLPALIDIYESAIRQERDGESIEELVEKSSYEDGNILLSSGVFEDKNDQRAARYVLIRKYVNAHPDRIFHTLNDYPDIPFRDSLILVGAYKSPRLLYDFAAADNKLGYAIRAIDDTLVRTVSRMAKSGGSGQLYFPFLDNILK